MKFSEFSKKYLELHAIPNKKSWRLDFKYINRSILPEFGELQLKSIKRLHIMEWHRRLSHESGPYYANRAHSLIRTMFNCAIKWEILQGTNPATLVTRNKEKSRTDFISPDVLPQFLIALHICKDKQVKAAILFQLFSGLRPKEVRELQWEDINLTSHTVRVRDTKNGKDHLLPLTPVLSSVLEALPRQGQWVFPGKQQNLPRSSFRKYWYKIRLAAGLPNLRLHDLRRTVGSYLAMDNFSDNIIRRILNHDSTEAVKVYTRFNLRSLESALTSHSDKIHLLATNAGLELPVFRHKEDEQSLHTLQS